MIRLTSRRQRASGALVGVILAGVLTTLASPADAYVRYTIKNSNIQFAWSQTCVPIVTYPNDMLSMMPIEELQAATTGAINAWNATGNSCTYLDISLTESTEPTPHAAHDNKNVLIYRINNWCKLSADESCDKSADTAYDPLALALTSVIASTKTGEIRDVDMEVNAHGFVWGDLVAHPELANDQFHQDLQNALTHEVGHLIGLDHTCYIPSAKFPRPLDNTGSPLVYCSEADAEVRATTMFPSAEPGDLEKRTLGADDLQALCEIYPIENNPMKCVPIVDNTAGGCGCAAATSPGPSGLLGLGLLAVALLGRTLTRGRAQARARTPRRRPHA
jgi:MYXO-CTERM domain-containing protein